MGGNPPISPWSPSIGGHSWDRGDIGGFPPRSETVGIPRPNLFGDPPEHFRNVHDSIKDAGEAIRRGAAALEVDGRPLQQGIFQYGIHGCRHRLG